MTAAVLLLPDVAGRRHILRWAADHGRLLDSQVTDDLLAVYAPDVPNAWRLWRNLVDLVFVREDVPPEHQPQIDDDIADVLSRLAPAPALAAVTS